MAGSPEGHAAIQRDLSRLERWAVNLIQFNKEKGRVPHLGRNNTELESSSAEKDLGVLLDTKLNVN